MSDWQDACDPVQPETPPKWAKGLEAQRRAAQMRRIKNNKMKSASVVPDFFILDDFDDMGA